MKKLNLTATALCAAMLWLGTAHAQRFIDNGDGTISDTKLGVMWEKKTGTVGGFAKLNDPHNVNARYEWSTDANQPNGSAFENFLYSLNHETSADGQTITGCFANHCDWQVPSVDDLKSIIDKNAPGCAKGTGPCIDPIFGATAADNYWSYTTARVLFYAYVVSFKDGGFEPISKAETAHLRAIRNDPCLIPGFCTNP